MEPSTDGAPSVQMSAQSVSRYEDDIKYILPFATEKSFLEFHHHLQILTNATT
jgi:hypothetical protein